MTTGTVKTQGTHIFFVDTVTTSDPELVRLICPTGAQDGGGAADRVEITCLDNLQDKEYVGGLGNPGTWTIPFNLIPREHSHQVLDDLLASKDTIHWMVALSESAAAPTLAGDGTMIPPATRSTMSFDAYVADLVYDIQTNEIVRGTLTLQRSGPVTRTWYTPA